MILASRGNAGSIVTRLLERCGYVVFRGGANRSRRHAAVWRNMIEHMRSHDGFGQQRPANLPAAAELA